MNVRKVNYNQKDAPYEFTRSLKQTGFSILTHHPIKKDLIDNVYMEWKSFFNSSLKDKYLFDPIKQDGLETVINNKTGWLFPFFN